ncbi:MAG TPA: hypothetical protein VHD36_05870 [Pirellulales bacterium]|nr:hypothetical protein [Pirellulales bacterium]
MTVLHSGSTKKFAAGWEGIFARRSAKGAAVLKTSPKVKKPSSARKPKVAKVTKRRPR